MPKPSTAGRLPAPLAYAGAGGLLRLLRHGDLLAAQPLQLRGDVVADPLSVPPFHGQDRYAVQVDAIVQVVAGGEAGLAGAADDVALLDLVARLHVDRAEVRVKGE